MKKLLYFLVIVAIGSSCSLKNKYQVSGAIKNAENKWLVFERNDLKGAVKLDSVKLDGSGKFKFKGERLTEPAFFHLRLSDKNYLTLLVDSTEQIQIEANGKRLEDTYSVENSLGSGYLKILNRKLRITRFACDSLLTLYKSVTAGNVVSKKLIEDEYLRVIDTHKKFISSFVMENPRSFASYYALFLEMNDQPIMNVYDKKDQIYFGAVATSLNLRYPKSERVKHLYNYVLEAKKNLRLQEATQLLLQNAKRGIPNIEAPTPQGRVVSLESLRGKVVLLSFWASIDEDSRLVNRQLKKLYNKYKSSGFEIYQVSLDKSKILWENAIEQDGIDWINVSDLQAANSYPARLYNVTTIPCNYLISRDGDIIGKDLFGSLLEEKLAAALR
jgi:peroxiredoxin